MSETPAEPTNMINRAMMMALMREHSRADQKMDAARAERSALRKRIKSYGVNIKNFDIAYNIATASDEGDAYIQNLREQQRLLQLANVSVGHQFSLVDEFDAAEKVDGTRAYQLGARAYIDDKGEDDNPHAVNSVEGQEWIKGYRDMEDTVATGLRSIAALDGGEAEDAADAAEGTKPLTPKKRGRPKKNADVGDAPGAPIQ